MAGPGESTTSTSTKSARDTIVVDLGKRRKKLIRQLRRGEGSLMNEVNQVINELKANNTITGAVQPVVLVVTERSDNTGFPFFGFLK